jgi:hypothetical protein
MGSHRSVMYLSVYARRINADIIIMETIALFFVCARTAVDSKRVKCENPCSKISNLAGRIIRLIYETLVISPFL